MHFEYEITAEDYVACQFLYNKLRLGRKRAENIATWIFVGFLFIAVAWTERSFTWGPFLLAGTGAWCVSCGFRGIFPASYLRRAYRKTNLKGKKFRAEINERGFEITGNVCNWRVSWPGVLVKGEDDRAFVLYSEGGTLFMFSKKYLNQEQLHEIRKLSGL
ncbi:MAG TPA: YcxB family protein [Candidatus Sulfotelmatobacter sp.]|jgi:hypothetical protein|nr:YcxB family protein [Candidatus Sulfotelmatobacter sp.]